MYKIKLYFFFYKNTIFINYSVSLIYTILSGISIFNFLLMMCSGGYFSSIIYKYTYRKNEFYMYYNAGISKFELFFSNLIINLLVFSICMIF